MQILLVEDDNTLFQELKKELEQWDFNVAGIEDFGKVMDTFESLILKLLYWMFNYLNMMGFIGAEK